MNRAQLLEKLAMELEEWPVTAEQARERLPKGFYLRTKGVFYPTCQGGGYVFSRNEWLEERTRLILTTSLGASSTACDDQFAPDPTAKPVACAECEGVRLTAFGDDCPACCKPEAPKEENVMKPGEITMHLGSRAATIELVDHKGDTFTARLRTIDPRHDGVTDIPLTRMDMECLHEALGKMLDRHGWDGAILVRRSVLNVRDEAGVRRDAHLSSMKGGVETSMSERKEGYYWVRGAYSCGKWVPWEWVPETVVLKARWADGAGEWIEEVGDRIPTPDEPWQCVPVDETAEMVEAGAQAIVAWDEGCTWPDSWGDDAERHRRDCRKAWRAMRDAAPKP